MFNQKNLQEIFKDGIDFGYGKHHLYFHAEDFDCEEQDVDIEVLDGYVKITEYVVDDKHARTDSIECIDYIPFEKIINISIGTDF